MEISLYEGYCNEKRELRMLPSKEVLHQRQQNNISCLNYRTVFVRDRAVIIRRLFLVMFCVKLFISIYTFTIR